jgi:hypothetical protein
MLHALWLPEITIRQGHDELPPATETPGMSLGAVLAHGRLKFKARD